MLDGGGGGAQKMAALSPIGQRNQNQNMNSRILFPTPSPPLILFSI